MEYGIARTYAIELTSDLTWSFYKKWGALRRFLKRGDPLGDFKGLSLGDVVPLSFPFNPPGYMARWSPTAASTDRLRHGAVSGLGAFRRA
jgi:hypothetical protein